jgi:hypothetical protein
MYSVLSQSSSIYYYLLLNADTSRGELVVHLILNKKKEISPAAGIEPTHSLQGGPQKSSQMELDGTPPPMSLSNIHVRGSQLPEEFQLITYLW